LSSVRRRGASRSACGDRDRAAGAWPVRVVLGYRHADGANLTLGKPGVQIRPTVREALSAEETRVLIDEIFPEHAP
jgi:hypothetical protein